MADNTINIKLEVNDGGQLADKTKRAKELNAQLKQMSTGTQTGNRAVAASTFGNQAYTQAGGVTGRTGAGARDFAAESQGLGGLVRLYATYAANLFAVTAAFRALSNAMDTTNMVQGLNQLSAATGQSLGNLSKRFTEASGGAISFREAMEATTKGSAAGLSSQQMLQLGDVAKKASQALGIAMPDAVSRLTRGISKLEPELLDELGLFTKLGKATEDYARRVGKTVDSLTDFEKRQAFANAVLKEGTDKFNEINIPTNPYDKLLASLKNLAQQILEVINKYLSPLIGLLSSSPTALAIGIALVAKTIIGQAIPAFKAYGDYLKKYSDDAAAIADKTSKAAIAARNARDASIMSGKDAFAERAGTVTETRLAAANAAAAGRIRKESADLIKRLSQTPVLDKDIEKDLAKLDKLGAKLKNTENVYTQLAKAIRDEQKANQDYLQTEQKLEAQKAKGPGMFSPAGIAAARAERARQDAASKGIISSASDITKTEGAAAALSKTLSSIRTEKLSILTSVFTGIASTAVIAGTAIAGFAAALNTVFLVIGTLIAVYAALDFAFSNNSKQVGIFEDKLTSLEEATKTATDTNKKYEGQLSSVKLIAQADAFLNIADSVRSVTQAFKDANAAASWWDRFTDSIAGIFGKSLSDKLANELASSISTALDTLSNPELKAQTTTQINSLLGITNISDARQALKKLENSPEYDTTNRQLNQILDTAKTRSQELALPLRAVKDGFNQLQKSYDEFSNSLLNRDPFTKWGLDLLRQSANLASAFGDSTNRLAVLNDLLKDTSQLNAFPPETRAGLLQAAKDAQGLNEELEQARRLMTMNVGGAQGAAKEQIIRLKIEGEGRFAAATEKLNSITTNLTTGLNAAMLQGFKLIEAPLTRAYAQANIDSARTLASFLTKSPEGVSFQTKLEVATIDLRKQEITSIRDLKNSIDAARISNEIIAAEQKIDSNKQKREDIVRTEGTASLIPGSLKATQIEVLDADTKKAEKALKDLDQQKRAVTTGRLNNGEIPTTESANIIANQIGYRTQLVQLNSQQQQIVMGGVVKQIEAGYGQAKEVMQKELDKLSSDNKRFFESPEFLSLSASNQERERARRQAGETEQQGRIADLGPMQARAVAISIEEQARASKLVVQDKTQLINLAQKDQVLADRNLTAQRTTRDIIAESVALEKDRTITVKEMLTDMEKAAQLESNRTRNIDLQLMQTQSSLSEEERLLEVKNSQDMLSEQQYLNEKRLLESKQLSGEFSKRTFDLEKQRAQELENLQRDMINAGGDQEEQTRITNLKAATDTYYNAAIDGERKLYDAKVRTNDLNNSLTARQIAYADVFKKTFEGMGDAIVDFVKTGKLDFTGLIDSMLTDLLRYELRLQAIALYQAMRPQLMAGVSWMGGSGVPSNADVTIPMQPGGGYAKGGVFDAGLQMFAKGGAFTNKIVNSPTLFANGAGLMGEAGPEAIMPLKRDSSGNLGVRSNGNSGNVDVVVNNYGNETATATETTDSRGNRRVEVTIGDVTAGEMNRSGSAPQKSLRNTYGIQPQLIRR